MSREERLNAPGVIALAIVIGSLLLLYWLVIPIVLGSLADTRGLSQDQIGWLASSYSAGICVATFASIFWIRKLSWQLLLKTGSLGVACGFALITVAEDFQLLLAGHVVASIFTGVAYAVIMALLGDSQHPARNYALIFFLQVVLGVGGSGALALIENAAHVLPIAASSMVILALVCYGLAPRLPAEGCKDGKLPPMNSNSRMMALPIVAALLAIVLVFTGDSGIWVFLERIGAEGHGRAFGATLVSINLAAGAAGSLSAAWLAERWGYLWPMVVAIVLSLASLGLFLADDYRTALIAASFVNGWAWNFGAAYRMALVARLDTSGRYTVLIPTMQTLGNTVGPAMTGLLLVSGGYALAFSTIASLWVAALACYWYGWQGFKRTENVDRKNQQSI